MFDPYLLYDLAAKGELIWLSEPESWVSMFSLESATPICGSLIFDDCALELVCCFVEVFS